MESQVMIFIKFSRKERMKGFSNVVLDAALGEMPNDFGVNWNQRHDAEVDQRFVEREHDVITAL